MAQMREELMAWRKVHPEATFDEIVAQVTPRRRGLMGQLIEEVVMAEAKDGEMAPTCPVCGEGAGFRGWQSRQVIHFEGETPLRRRYYYCPRCKRGFFPPGSASWAE